ncbi:MAG: LytTR family transcriptional regulator [Lachnospiraceae bacterium]|nr:LytTR family transcriptional regulator [Lachnospiraceae bacterium]
MNIDFYGDEFIESNLLKAQVINYLTQLTAAERDELLNTIVSSKTKVGSYPAVKEIIFENHSERTGNLKCIRFKCRLYMVEIEQITRIQHLGRNAFFYFRNSDEFKIRCRLKDLAEVLKAYPDMFIRINNTEYVSLSRIREIHKNMVRLDTGESCYISRSYLIRVRSMLKDYDFLYDKTQS